MIRVHDVLDGYTESLKIGDETVLFRPMLAAERRLMFHRAGRMAPAQGLWFLEEIVHSRVIWGHVDFGGMTRANGEAIVRTITGAGSSRREKADVENLYRGVVLELKYPWLSKTSCDYCRKFWWSPLTGQVARECHNGPPLERDPGQTLLCADGQCPKGTPEKPLTLSKKNRLAWLHFQQCDASSFPIDSIVQRNAQVIRAAIRKAGHVPRSAK